LLQKEGDSPTWTLVAAKEGESPSLLYPLIDDELPCLVPLSLVTAVHAALGYENRFHTDGEN